MSRLNDKTAVITGGGSGIGLASAQRFIDEGAFVYIFGRRKDVLDAAAATLGDRARAVQGSVTDLADLDRLFATVKAERGTLDILFANAGTGDLVALGEITPEQYDRAFDINVKGVLFTVQKGLPLLGAGGSIILTGSSAGAMGTPQFSVYSATKAAIRNFARSWALDLSGTGIRVNVLSPGPTKTELALEVVGDEGMDAIGAGTPLGRVGDPTEIAAVAAFLASTDSSFMTGGEVFVDGGLAQV
jgi:NAD(P)-dependent dehydrogenase (short-subunit alcohol dehydrogenase family)